MFEENENLPKKFPCPLCGELKRLQKSKKDKPYYYCDYCGVQVFIRGKLGIQKLSNLNNSGVIDSISKNDPKLIFELIQIESKIEFMKSKINKLEEKSWETDLIDSETKLLIQLKESLIELEFEFSEKIKNL